MKHIRTEITFVNFPHIEEEFVEKIRSLGHTFFLNHMSGVTKILVNARLDKQDLERFNDHIVYIRYDIWYDSFKVEPSHINEVDAILDTMSHRLSGLIDE